MSGPPSLGTNHSNQGEESAVRHASSGVPSNGFQASGQSASGGAFPCRRLSWRQQNGRSAGDDVSEPGNESIESIPRAEWTRGRRPSWRRLSSTDANVQKLDTEEKQPSMQLESGGAVCRGGKAAGAEQVPERTAGDVHRSEGGGASKEKEDSPGMGLLESERQGGASFADETVLVAGQRDSTEVGSAERQFPEGDEGKEERGRLGSKESNSGGTGLRAEAAAVSGRSASIGGDGPNGRYGSEETNEADMEYSAVESNEIEGPTEGHGVEEDATQRGEDRNNRKEEETELAPERPEKRQTEKPVLGTVRRRSVNIAELKRLAAVEVRSRRGSESDVTIQQPTEGDGISQVDGTQRVESREAAERPLVLDVTNGSRDGQAGALSASVAAKVPAKEDARAAVPAREGRSGGESWQQEETRSEGTSKKLEEGGGEEPQEEEGGEATEDDRGASAQKRSKRRTSADLLKGDWLTKAREIGEPDWVAPTETARGVNRGDAGGGIKCGVEKRGGGEEKAVVKKVESTHVGGTANGGVFVERREEGQERLGAREKESTREDGAGSGTDSQASGKRATDKRITPSVFAKEDERGATGVPIIFPAEVSAY